MQCDLRKRIAKIEIRRQELSRPTMEQIREAMEGYDPATGAFPPDTPENVKEAVIQAMTTAQLIDESVIGGGLE